MTTALSRADPDWARNEQAEQRGANSGGYLRAAFIARCVPRRGRHGLCLRDAEWLSDQPDPSRGRRRAGDLIRADEDTST